MKPSEKDIEQLKLMRQEAINELLDELKRAEKTKVGIEFFLENIKMTPRERKIWEGKHKKVTEKIETIEQLLNWLLRRK